MRDKKFYIDAIKMDLQDSDEVRRSWQRASMGHWRSAVLGPHPQYSSNNTLVGFLIGVLTFPT